MAKIWLCRDGGPNNGGPLGERPLPWCQDKLKLKVVETNYLGDLTAPPRFGEKDDPVAPFREYRYVVVEVTEADAPPKGAKCGFYLADVTPKEAAAALAT